ncbi:nucleotide-binding protein [Candidatus Woesearchaeota archaeon]|nr:nucleotide-binding protein [Candidatus Woesearchaeota archaeon]MBW3006321.1 nucleotide-binding protein [Candidatus Woesearchaeota archaeon]
MRKVVLDTDFLIHCASAKIDYAEELRRILDFSYKTYIIDKTIDELDNIIETKKGKTKANAKLAKAILKAKKIPLIKTKKDKIVDELILKNAAKNCIVATMDADLKRKLKAKGIPRIVIRQKKYLVLLD